MRRVTVVYEDSSARSVLVRDYGLHKLVVACLVDDLGLPHHEVAAHVLPHPANGNDKALRKWQGDLIPPVVALVDDDRLTDLLDLTADACKRQILQAIETRYVSVASDRVLVLLHRNVESVVSAAAAALGLEIPPKSPEERDRVLRRAAADAAARAAVRASCEGTFARLLAKVGALLGANDR